VRRGSKLIVCLPLLLAACGSVILSKPTAQTVSNAVYRRVGFRPTDVSCPSGIPAKVGGRFQCHFTGPDGPYVADLRILRVNGQRVDYQIQSRRTG
jgi:hypothetical protein